MKPFLRVCRRVAIRYSGSRGVSREVHRGYSSTRVRGSRRLAVFSVRFLGMQSFGKESTKVEVLVDDQRFGR